ncbi:2,3-diaminopropionate biosynthesis protein SbnA [Thalassomonas actiniarum]|uniref:N-(2-amino-2-carboxyethyl)-L-glutamate synthase n=1 Tax=Thalassomonas actiniarum TaxID=485447 RepID=A0AAE9YRL5_9GAMM|nr:2,3-diaminopropionate biosynthesis protein SbnA [Thalassomonas actiniarum]WDD99765.1 2,3-diaminopropionate biosynthesis protein SbnA [Thalassomonas actiniarum]
MNDNIVSCVGNTPIVSLSRLFNHSKVEVLAKMELMNPGGSIKDRPAKYMLEQGMKSGKINKNSHIIESSSGNLAIALAMHCKLHGLRFTAVVDPKISPTNLKMIKLYGANVVQVTEKDENDGYLLTRINTVKHLVETTPNAVWVNQYANPHNWQSHFYGEAEEIINQVEGSIDYLVIGASTSGTLMGVSRRLKQAYPDMQVVAVDISGSVLFGGPSGPREIPGIGASRVPELLEPSEVDQVIYVDDYESALACYKLLEHEGIFAGGSSGSSIAAIEKLLPNIAKGSRVLTLFPDRGDRYLDLIYDDNWLEMVRQRHLNSSANTNNRKIA